MTARLVITPPDDVFKAVLQQMNKQTRPLMVKNFQKEIAPVSEWVIETLGTEPPKPNYPIKWQTIKQRKAYFATNGFGHGIPYKRTHKLSQSWQTVFRLVSQRQAQWAVFNDNPAAQFVQGPQVQKMHVDRWVQIDSIETELNSRVENATIQAWFNTAETVTTVKGKK